MNTPLPRPAEAAAPEPRRPEDALWQSCCRIAELYKVTKAEVLTGLFAVFAGLAGSRIGIEGDPPVPLPFPLLLVPDRDREPVWLREFLDPVHHVQEQYSEKIGPGLHALHDPIAARKDLRVVEHLRQYEDLFEEEIRSLEFSASLKQRPHRWIFSHHVGTAGSLVPSTGTGAHLLALLNGKRDLRLLTRQADHPRSLLKAAQPEAANPRVTLLGWVDQATVKRVMSTPGSPLSQSSPLLLPVSPGQAQPQAPIGLNRLIGHALGGLMEKRWIEVPWQFAPADRIRARVDQVESAFRDTVEKAPDPAQPWLAALPGLPMRLVATAHFIAAIFGDHASRHGRDELTTGALQLAGLLRTRLEKWLPTVLPDASDAKLTDLDLKILDHVQRHSPITLRELQRRVHRLRAPDRDASLARLEGAGMITREGGFILSKH